MSTAIYFFTGTGNSLAVARDIATRMDGQLVPIASVVNQASIAPGAEVIGIVFPVYYASMGDTGMPQIMQRFAARLEDIRGSYIFAVCTHGGGPRATIGNLARAIEARGGTLAAGFAVQMSIPYAPLTKIGHALFGTALRADPLVEQRQQQAFSAGWGRKLQVIEGYVGARRTGHLETHSPAHELLSAPWLGLQNRMALLRYRELAGSPAGSLAELVPLADRSFRVDGNCTGCGICARLCPVGNIEMAGNRPLWQHHCETCYACYQWCPQKAIHGDVVEYEKRYHHPDVNLSDMLRQRTQECGAGR